MNGFTIESKRLDDWETDLQIPQDWFIEDKAEMLEQVLLFVFVTHDDALPVIKSLEEKYLHMEFQIVPCEVKI